MTRSSNPPSFFEKYTGAGNDFLLFDCRREDFAPSSDWINAICDRHFGVGADGVILLKDSENASFQMDFYNSDGFKGGMCGNGARCLAAYLADHQLATSGTLDVWGQTIPFRKDVGDRYAVTLQVQGNFEKNIELREGLTAHFLNTGVPHAVIFVPSCKEIAIGELGPYVRFHQAFQPEGANVNFAEVEEGGKITVRTYERGVEGETLACGTGAAASALAAHYLIDLPSPINVHVKSGAVLTVSFDSSASPISEIEAKGPAKKVFEGSFSPSWHPSCI